MPNKTFENKLDKTRINHAQKFIRLELTRAATLRELLTQNELLFNLFMYFTIELAIIHTYVYTHLNIFKYIVKEKICTYVRVGL